MHIVTVTTAAVLVALSFSSVPAFGARWKICTGGGRHCNTACGVVIASFPTFEQCQAAIKTVRLPPNKLNNPGKPAGAAAMADCRRRYGKTVNKATLSSDGKRVVCHYIDPAFSSKDPNVVRDACKKYFGPTSQIRRQSGKWYCTA
jgi:hypothetical protein